MRRTRVFEIDIPDHLFSVQSKAGGRRSARPFVTHSRSAVYFTTATRSTVCPSGAWIRKKYTPEETLVVWALEPSQSRD